MTNLRHLYFDAIAMERAKISEYEARIRSCMESITALEALMERIPDDVDEAIERKLLGGGHDVIDQQEARAAKPSELVQVEVQAPPSRPPVVAASPIPPAPYISPAPPRAESDAMAGGVNNEHFVMPKREVSPQAVELLRYLRTPATLDEVEQYAISQGIKMNRAALSTFLYSYRTRFGFLTSVEDARYVLTKRGSEYIDDPSRRNISFKASDAGATASEDATKQVDDLTHSEGNDRNGGY
jgi:hypothetical protein